MKSGLDQTRKWLNWGDQSHRQRRSTNIPAVDVFQFLNFLKKMLKKKIVLNSNGLEWVWICRKEYPKMAFEQKGQGLEF